MAKPVILIVHAAWHRPIHYLPLITPLLTRGYTVVAPAMPTGGHGDETVAGDTRALREVIKPYFDRGEEIVILCHSSGGMAATDFAAGNTVKDRQGRGSVKAVIYMAAFAPFVPGHSAFDMTGVRDAAAQHPAWWEPDANNDCMQLTSAALDVLFHDIPKPVAAAAMNSMVKQSLAGHRSPCQHAASEIDAPLTYIHCSADKAIPPAFQTMLAEKAKMRVVMLKGFGHEPFLRADGAEKVLRIVEEVAEGST